MDSSRALFELSDDNVLSNLRKAALAGHRRLKQVLLYLGEVEERRLHLKGAFTSMFDFCIRSLGMSDGEAYRRIRAARLVRTFPTLLEWIERGDLNLSTLILLRPHLTESNLDELVAATSRKVKLDVQRVLAARFPKAHAPSSIHRLPDTEPTTSFEQAGTLPLGPDFGFEAMPLSTEDRTWRSALARGRVTPLSATHVHVEFAATAKLDTNLTRALDLMSHDNPTRELGVVFERALELLVAKLERERREKVARPRTSARAAESAPSSHSTSAGRISQATRREVFARDGDQCTYEDEHGNRCPARAPLEIDHVLPKARGGSNDASNLRVRCRAHNLWYAEQVFGREHIAERIRQRQEQSRQRATAFQNSASTPTSAALGTSRPHDDPNDANSSAAPRVSSSNDASDPRADKDALHRNRTGDAHDGGTGSTSDTGTTDSADMCSNNESAADSAAARSSDTTDEALFAQALRGLGHLGFRSSDARRAVEQVRGRPGETPMTVELILRQALAILTSR